MCEEYKYEYEYNNINYPFGVYPSSLMSGYISYDIYREEVLSLYNYLIILKKELLLFEEDTINIILINIGSVGEEKLYYYEKHNINEPEEKELEQWKQLHPNLINDFIKKYINNKKINIKSIIVSPDNYLEDEDYIPYFARGIIIIEDIEICYNKNGNCYSYINEEKDINIEIIFFNCFCPNIEKNVKLINKGNYLLNNLEDSPYEIKDFNSTKEDIKFVNNFYDLLEELFLLNNYSNVNIIVNNFATFRSIIYDSKFMFNILYLLCNKHKILFLEWKNEKGNNKLENLINIIFNKENLKNKKIKYFDNTYEIKKEKDMLIEKLLGFI